MKKYVRAYWLLIIIFMLPVASAFAALPVNTPKYQVMQKPTVQNIRISQTLDKLRIVIDVNKLPVYNVFEEADKDIVIELPGVINNSKLSEAVCNDPIVNGLRLIEDGQDKLLVVLDLKMKSQYKVFNLQFPNRIVIDIIRFAEQKLEEQVVPGIKYTYWRRGKSFGTVTAYIADIAPKAGYTIKTALSNDAIVGLETVLPITKRNKGIVGVNGSYFAQNGEILGLLKINGQIASTPTIMRSAWGICKDGHSIIDTVEYNGKVELPNGQSLTIDGVNRERGPNELLLYNGFYGQSTCTNGFGIDYIIIDDKVAEINNKGNSTIIAGSRVLSAHGEAADMLSSLAVGDIVKLTQTLGADWDKTVCALGAGPTLVKGGKIFVTTKVEEFGSDVADGRAPRTALGITAAGHTLLIVVDGRKTHSAGLTLFELADFMRELGAVEAINLDGGGSSTMVINDKVVNQPSDGHDRQIGSAIIVVPTQLEN